MPVVGRYCHVTAARYILQEKFQTLIHVRVLFSVPATWRLIVSPSPPPAVVVVVDSFANYIETNELDG
jgi:hypothetical protein